MGFRLHLKAKPIGFVPYGRQLHDVGLPAFNASLTLYVLNFADVA